MKALPERIVLLGASGFVGSAVVRQITANPQLACEAHLLVHETPLHNAPASAHIHHGSLTQLPADLLPPAPHAVLLCASKQIDRDGSGFDINLRGVDALLAAVTPDTRAIVYVSSYSVYGDDAQRGIRENAPVRPQSALARVRAECEAKLIAFSRRSHCRVIICRTRFVLGADDRFVLPGIAKLARAGVKVGTGDQRFSIIAVDDFARILLTLAQQALAADSTLAASEVYNIGYAQPISLNDIYSVLADTLPAKPPRWRIPVNAALLRVVDSLPSRGARQLVQRLRLIGYDHYGDVNKLQSQLGNDWLQSDAREVLRSIASSFSFRSGASQ